MQPHFYWTTARSVHLHAININRLWVWRTKQWFKMGKRSRQTSQYMQNQAYTQTHPSKQTVAMQTHKWPWCAVLQPVKELHCVRSACELGEGELFLKKNSSSLIISIVWLPVSLFRGGDDDCVLVVLNSCEVAAVMLCAHTEQPMNYWDPKLKIVIRTSGHASLTSIQSILWASPPGCRVSLYAGRQPASPPPHMALSSEVPRLQQKFCLLTTLWADSCKELQWGTHTSAHAVLTLCLPSVIWMKMDFAANNF